MGCNVSKTAPNQVGDIDSERREGARSGSSVSLTNWSPDAEKASSSSSASVADSITLIHFNDVYNIEERSNGKEPIGGAARFKSQIDSLRHLEPLILFSGDALNPSNSQFSILYWCMRICFLFILCMLSVCDHIHNDIRINPVKSGYKITHINPHLVLTPSIFCLTLGIPSLFLTLSFFPAVSIVTEGRQMVPILKAIGVHAAVYGNHDFGNTETQTYLHVCNTVLYRCYRYPFGVA